MAVPKATEKLDVGMVVCRKDRAYTSIGYITARRDAGNVEIELHALCLPTLSFLHTTISTSSLCGSWHCYPYIPLHVHFWCAFLLYNSTPEKRVLFLYASLRC